MSKRYCYPIAQIRGHRPPETAFLRKFPSWKLPVRISQLMGQMTCSTLFVTYSKEYINLQSSGNSQLHCFRDRGTSCIHQTPTVLVTTINISPFPTTQMSDWNKICILLSSRSTHSSNQFDWCHQNGLPQTTDFVNIHSSEHPSTFPHGYMSIWTLKLLQPPAGFV